MSSPPIVIISESDPMISGVLRVEFSRWDFAVLLAISSEEAASYASQAVASLVVLDAGHAHLSSAYEACARIRRRDGYAARPIVMTVKELSPRAMAAAEVAGATALVAKPYSMMDLLRAATSHLPPDDPFMLAGHSRPGVGAPPIQEWKQPKSLEWRCGGDSALSRNKLLLPIVRGFGQKIPFGGKVA